MLRVVIAKKEKLAAPAYLPGRRAAWPTPRPPLIWPGWKFFRLSNVLAQYNKGARTFHSANYDADDKEKL